MVLYIWRVRGGTDSGLVEAPGLRVRLQRRPAVYRGTQAHREEVSAANKYRGPWCHDIVCV